MVNEQQVREALQQVKFPGLSRDIVSFGLVREIRVEGESLTVLIAVNSSRSEVGAEVEQQARAVLEGLPGVAKVDLHVTTETPAQAAPPRPTILPEVRFKIAVASGKGGVGKSTIAANLALALQRTGLSVGLLDADVYGPSQQLMMGPHTRPVVTPEEKILPVQAHGVRMMSLGLLMEPDTPVIWRGPMVMKALEQFLTDVEWGALDVLVVDLPPGTGDAQLTLTQQVPLDGAIIVTTPQDVALIDARKGLVMFTKLNVPVLGVVENMSVFVCPHCGGESDIFKRGGGERTARELNVPFLGAIPLDPAVVTGGDAGQPIVAGAPESAAGRAFTALAASVRARLENGPAAAIQP